MAVACGGEDPTTEPTIAPGEGADSPVTAVEELVAAINTPDFADASRLAVPGQAALAALAEGATFGEVARSLSEGDEEIAANFWTGFAQETGDFLAGEVSVVDDGTVEQDDVEFHRVSLTPPDGSARTIIVRNVDGYRVDLFASFGSGLADKMAGPVERLLATKTADARLILAELQKIVPSLHVAASLPDITPSASQQLFALIEVITRVG
ncbi:MAG TPA: hypothetical protein VF148_05290 [Acidimicrobiia bacterium]